MVGIETNAAGATAHFRRPNVARREARDRLSKIELGLVASVAFLGLLLFAMTPRQGDATLLVVFAPGTSDVRMVEAVGRAGARLVAFSRLPFAVQVHIETREALARLRAASLLVASTRGLVGCMRSPPTPPAGSAS